MPNPIYTSLSSVGTVTAYVDPATSPTTVGVEFATSSMSAAYNVQYTLDDPLYLAAIGSTRAAVWFNDPTLASSVGISSGATTSYTYPIAGVRVNVSAISSGTVVLSVLQRAL